MNIQIRKEESYEKATQQRLRHEILCCISRLVSELTPHAETLSDWTDELYELGSVTEVTENQYRIYNDGDSYHIVLVEELDQDDEDIEPLTSISHADLEDYQSRNPEAGEGWSAILDWLQSESDVWNKQYTLLDENDDPEVEDREVFEHWLVTDYGAGQLRSVGEKVVEAMDLNIWCRTCTGQSIWMDSWARRLGEQYCQD